MIRKEIIVVDILDHGYIKLVESWGSDSSIIEAARLSTNKGFLGWDPVFECKYCGYTWNGSLAVIEKAKEEGRKCCVNQEMIKKRDGDEKLLKYLYENQHSTPFEMAGAIFEVYAPIMVYREWMRHRTQCLDGDTLLYFDSPRRAKRGHNGGQKISVQKLYNMWTEGGLLPIRKIKPSFSERLDLEKYYSVSELSILIERRKEDIRNNIRSGRLKAVKEQQPIKNKPSLFVMGKDWMDFSERVFTAKIDLKNRIRRMFLRSLNEKTNKFINTHIVDVLFSGKKEVYELELKDGKKIRCSKDHKFIINGVWNSLELGINLTRSHNGVISWGKDVVIRTNGQLVTGGKFKKDQKPWNLGKKYKTNHIVTEEHREIIKKARSGEKSNFWKGGVCSNRGMISRWTSDQAPKVHRKHKYTCQLCGNTGCKLHCHHVIPVRADANRGFDFNNLTSLCEKCHRNVNGRELEYVELLTGKPLEPYLVNKKYPKSKGAPFLVGKDIGIKNVTFVGVRDCYDVTVDGPYHNFVANGIVTHNSYNEMSGRYVSLPDFNYVPTVERCLLISNTNKQAGTIKGADTLTEESAQEYIRELEDEYKRQEEFYQRSLKRGIPKELARVHIGVGRYSRMRASANLRNWLAFLTLRMAPNAQWEIRQYANAVGLVLSELFPRTWELFIGGESE